MPTSFSSAGQALGLGDGGAYANALTAGGAAEDPAAKKKRLQALATAQANITGSPSAASQALFGSGGGYGSIT